MLKPLVTLISFLAVLVALLGPATATTATAVVATPPVVTTASAAAAPSWPANVVYVYDRTAALKKADGTPVWPVAAAAERWDDGNPIDFRYTTRGCPTGTQCVLVQQQELAGSTVGSTATGSLGTDLVSATVVLDTTFGRKNSAARRRNVVCHELGHTLGLVHRSGTTSCMTSYVTNQRFPDKTDIKQLNATYTR